ncbi:MAG: STAS domain-containing protein [Colwellia sp.]
MSTIRLTLQGNNAALIGNLTRYTVGELPANKYSIMFEHCSVTIDLAQVVKVDTAGLAWLLYLYEQGKNCACQLHFIHLPKDLNKLIELSGVEGFLPVKST